LKLKCDEPLSNFAFNFNLRRYTGGELCVESGPAEVTVINTHNRVAAIDGRFVHWVAPGYSGERFSLIYYRRTPDPAAAEPAVRAVHKWWWAGAGAAGLEAGAWTGLAAGAGVGGGQGRGWRRGRGRGRGRGWQGIRRGVGAVQLGGRSNRGCTRVAVSDG